ncbi:MAG: mannose-1-phosphate guanylyltransferase/mannose-6-phosphate isomerase [bacterium]|nr:mannose-1-phosphate guanylyltransferase/mannose-6-phosphate isomerase [bacterium]
MSSKNKQSIHPYILSGGSGTRLWPLSRKSYPKQFLKLVGEDSLLQQTAKRLRGPNFRDPSVLANNDHRFIIAEQMQLVGVKPKDIILEPVGRNTAPAALVAALRSAQPDEDALILLLPSDHIIKDVEKFQETILSGIADANKGHLVTFGIKPTAPETGYGYIETSGDPQMALDVERFVEKPVRAKAKGYLAAGNFFWNAGIFMYRAGSMIEAFANHAPQILRHCRAALEKAQSDLDFLRLDKPSYAQCESISLDYAIMEKANGIKCIPLETDWSDLGAWSAIWDAMDKDKNGNVIKGDVVIHNTKNSFIQSAHGTCLSLVGLDNVLAIATKDAILLANKDNAQDVKAIVDKLQASGRTEAVEHRRVYRPWGWYEQLSAGNRFQVKVLMVNPGAQLSLQSHYHRAEHWVVVSGTAEVRVGDKISLLSENESTYIPIGTLHRLGNPGKLPAMLIEVQSGSYLGEDDIERYEDDFGRGDS